jgi:hypothetical protein
MPRGKNKGSCGGTPKRDGSGSDELVMIATAWAL